MVWLVYRAVKSLSTEDSEQAEMIAIAIYFRTDARMTRLIAKQIGPELAQKPVNINRTTVDDFLMQDKLILGIPTYGEGVLPGITAESWEDFLAELSARRLDGKWTALYGMGDQEKYGEYCVDPLFSLHAYFSSLAATLIGDCDPEGYGFVASRTLVTGRLIGLALDNHRHSAMTDERIDRWLGSCLPLFDEEAGVT